MVNLFLEETVVRVVVEERGTVARSGYLIKKSTVLAGGKQTKWGHRGWSKSFVVVNPMSLDLFKVNPMIFTDEYFPFVLFYHYFFYF